MSNQTVPLCDDGLNPAYIPFRERALLLHLVDIGKQSVQSAAVANTAPAGPAERVLDRLVEAETYLLGADKLHLVDTKALFTLLRCAELMEETFSTRFSDERVREAAPELDAADYSWLHTACAYDTVAARDVADFLRQWIVARLGKR